MKNKNKKFWSKKTKITVPQSRCSRVQLFLVYRVGFKTHLENTYTICISNFRLPRDLRYSGRNK